jgi:hypothetical protein
LRQNGGARRRETETEAGGAKPKPRAAQSDKVSNYFSHLDLDRFQSLGSDGCDGRCGSFPKVVRRFFWPSAKRIEKFAQGIFKAARH